VRAAIYARISQDPTGTSAAPDRQLADCQLACARKGWDVVAEFVDRDLSAWNTKTRRPQFEELMAGVRERRFDSLVVYNIDRLVRNVLTGWRTLDELIKLDVKLVSCTQEIDTSTPAGKANFTQYLAFAEQESRDKSRRIKRALSDKAARGDAHGGGSRPYGYRRIGASLEPIDEEVRILREIRDRLLGGTSLRAMAFNLNERGITTTGGNQWSGSQLAQTLASPSLAGLRGHRTPRLDDNGSEVKDQRGDVLYDRDLHPAKWKDNAIFSVDEWTDLLAVIHGRSRRYHGAGVDAQRHLLSGLCYCGLCGKRLSYRSKKYKRSDKLVTFGSYVCVRGPGISGCGRLGITSSSFENYVVEQVLNFVSKARLRPTNNDEALLSELTVAQDGDIESRKQLDRERFILRTRDESSYRPIYEELSARIESQRMQLASLTARRDERKQVLVPGDRQELQQYWDELSLDEKRSTLRSMLRKVEVNPAQVKGSNVFHGDQRVRLEFNWTAYLAAAEQFEATATPDELIAAEEQYRQLNAESWLSDQS
jgi:site-specific DNA recombinase